MTRYKDSDWPVPEGAKQWCRNPRSMTPGKPWLLEIYDDPPNDHYAVVYMVEWDAEDSGQYAPIEGREWITKCVRKSTVGYVVRTPGKSVRGPKVMTMTLYWGGRDEGLQRVRRILAECKPTHRGYRDAEKRISRHVIHVRDLPGLLLEGDRGDHDERFSHIVGHYTFAPQETRGAITVSSSGSCSPADDHLDVGSDAQSSEAGEVVGFLDAVAEL